MRLPDARLWLVHDAEDLPASTSALYALADLDGGIVVVRVTPGPRRRHTIAKDVLSALGKDHDRCGAVRNGEENWRRCAAWLSAERVRHLIVDRAENLQPDRWQDFIGLASRCGASLWLVAHGASLTRGQRELLDDWPLGEVAFDEFIAEHAVRAADGDGQFGESIRAPALPSAPFPKLPHSDFTTFRADCRALLAPAAFQRVDAEMRWAVDMTRRWLAATSDPEALPMDQHLRQLIEDCRSIGQALARLRAAQAACLIGGLLVAVDLERLAMVTQTVRPLVDRQLVTQLRAYTSTHLAAVALVACVTGASPEAMTRLNVADAAEDVVRVAGKQFPVPVVARCILAAHLHKRLAEGALPQHALFADAQRGEPGERLIPRALRAGINNVAKASGLMLWGEPSNKAELSGEIWLRRRGVSVKVLR